MQPTLMLIPGWGGNEHFWEDQVQDLSDIANCQVLSLKGKTSRDQMVDHLLATAPAQFLLAGQSMGGWVAIKAAAKAPERISKLLLLNTWASPDVKLNMLQRALLRDLKNEELEQVVAHHLPLILHPDNVNNPDLIAKLRQMFGECKTGVLIDHMQAMLDDYTSLSLLPLIKMPTLIIHGQEDQLFPLEEQEVLHKGIKGSELKVIKRCGHCSPIECPKEVAALMRAFIA